MDESELISHLRWLCRRPPEATFRCDPLYLIRATNYLRPLGKEKIIAILGAFNELAPFRSDDPFWIVRVLFEAKDPPGFFELPRIGAIQPPPPDNLGGWPDFPLLRVQRIPFSCYQGAVSFGHGESFRSYAKGHQYNWVLRTEAIRPPDDPFSAAEEAIKSPRWQSEKRRGGNPGPRIDSSVVEQVLCLVRNAYRPVGLKEGAREAFLVTSPGKLEQYHREFLRVGGHWDTRLQMYVRRDETFIPDGDH